MDLKESPSEGSLQPSSIQIFANTSTLHGIRHIFVYGPVTVRRVLWAVAFVGSLGLLLVESSERVSYYFSYQHVTKVDEVVAQSLVFPAVTLCNLNGFRFSRLTTNDLYHAGELLALLDVNLQIPDPHLADPTVLEALRQKANFKHYKPKQFSMLEFLHRVGHDLKDMMLYCKFKGQECGYQDFTTVPTRKEEPLPPAPSQSIPAFYFPRGRPKGTVDTDAIIAKVESTFAQFPQEKATMADMGSVAKACGCPLYWKAPLFCGAGGERTGSVSVHKFVAMWRKILHTCHDAAARFLHLLGSPGCNYLVQEDFIPFLQDVVNTHPGLAFLREAAEFHSRYITTVIQRIFYTVNRSWTGRITCAELRRSTFLQNVALLEEEADINQLTEYFSYEHFYVIYCKFWELDTDHDLLIDAQDLARHNDHAISTKMIERIFSGAVTRGRSVQKEGKMSYADFVWFLISEEDKNTPTSIEYWFRCMDLDGDGALSMFELQYFYEEQCRRLDSMAIEALPFEDCLCQMLDLVKPQREGRISLGDLKKCKLAYVFFDTFFNVEKYLDHEQREQVSLLRESESEGPELSDWEKYAAEEYDILVAEEAAGESWGDGYEAELSPVDQKLSMLRSPLAQRPFFEVPSTLGTIDLCECGDDDLPPS